MGIGVGAFQIAEQDFFGEQLLRALQIAVQEHAHTEAQVGNQTRVKIANFFHARGGETAPFVDLLFLEIVDDALDDVADLLHVDRERHDIRPAAAFLLFQRLVADLRKVELDRGVKVVDDIVHLAQSLRERAVVGPQHGQHSGKHLLDHVADPHRLARGVADREGRRGERRWVEIARLARIVDVGLRRHQPCRDAGDLLGEEHERHGDGDVENEMEMHDQPVFGGIDRGKQRFHVIEKRREGDAADQLEQKIAERHAPRLGRRMQRVQHRHHAAAQVRSEHQRQRDMNADDLRRRERCREQHDGEAGIRQDREHCADEHVEQQVARERGKDHLDAGSLGNRLRRQHDPLQGHDDQAQADQDATEAADLAVLAVQEQHHAGEDEEGRQPRQIEREEQHHEARPDVGAEHHRERGCGRDQALAHERRDDERGCGAALQERGDCEPGAECREAVGDALPQHAAQIAAVEPQDVGADDVRAPDEQRNAGEQVEEDLHPLACVCSFYCAQSCIDEV